MSVDQTMREWLEPLLESKLAKDRDTVLKLAAKAGFDVGAEGQPAHRIMFHATLKAWRSAEPAFDVSSPLYDEEQRAMETYRSSLSDLLMGLLT